jgi:hypothetical protein
VRWILAGGLLALATLMAVAACFGVWGKRQALETDPWVDTSERLLENETIRDELGREFSNRLFAVPEVRNRLDSVSEEDREALKEEVRKEAPRVLGSEAALRAWKTANRTAHELMLRFLDDERDTVVLNVRALLQDIAKQADLPETLVDEVPRNVQNLEIVSEGEVTEARQGADLLRALAIVLPLLTLLLLAGAVLVAPDRRKAVAAVGASLFVAGLLVILLRASLGNAIVDSLVDSSQAKPAADEAWSIASSLLFGLGLTLLIGGAIILVAGVVASMARARSSY